jgi:hypothetical protein
MFATRGPQQKIFQDKFAIAAGKRRSANSAFDLAVPGFGSGFGSDNLIKRVAVGALEKWNSHGSSHGVPPTDPRLSVLSE